MFLKVIVLYLISLLIFIIISVNAIIILTYAAVRGIGALFAGISPEVSVYIYENTLFIILSTAVVCIFYILRKATNFDIVYILRKVKKRTAAIVFIMITAIIFANNLIDLFVEKKDWVVTTGTVECIGGPEGLYFGSYIDECGKIREQTEIYDFPFRSLYGFAVFDFIYEPLVNNEISIHYDPSTVYAYPGDDYFVLCDSELYFSEMADLILSAVLFIASLVFLVLNIKPKVSKTDTQSGSNNKRQGSAIDSGDISKSPKDDSSE